MEFLILLGVFVCIALLVLVLAEPKSPSTRTSEEVAARMLEALRHANETRRDAWATRQAMRQHARDVSTIDVDDVEEL